MYRCHVALKYDVDFGGPEIGFSDFLKLRDCLEERSELLGIENPCYAWSDDDEWWEFDRERLQQVADKLEDNEEDEELREFILDLLMGTPDEDFVRVECW